MAKFLDKLAAKVMERGITVTAAQGPLTSEEYNEKPLKEAVQRGNDYRTAFLVTGGVLVGSYIGFRLARNLYGTVRW